MLQIIDQRWQDHLADMDYLKEGINLRGHGQPGSPGGLAARGIRPLRQAHGRHQRRLPALRLPRAGAHRGARRRARPGPGQLRGRRRPGPGRRRDLGGLRHGHARRDRSGRRRGRRLAAGPGRCRPPRRREPPRLPSSSPTGRRSAATSRAGAAAARSSSSATAPTEMAGGRPRRGTASPSGWTSPRRSSAWRSGCDEAQHFLGADALAERRAELEKAASEPDLWDDAGPRP